VTQRSPNDGSRGRDEHELLVAELERRIRELEQLPDSAFGRFTAWDWLLCGLFAIAVPHLILWWFA